jgi:hypothetical protein
MPQAQISNAHLERPIGFNVNYQTIMTFIDILKIYLIDDILKRTSTSR